MSVTAGLPNVSAPPSRSDVFLASARATPPADDLSGAREWAETLLDIIDRDQERLKLCNDYYYGQHNDPYMPRSANDEYRLLAKRAVSNWMPLVVATPAQQMYVDGFRSGDTNHDEESWSHWQRSGLDSRQHAVYRGAFMYGHAFVKTEIENGKAVSRGLSPRKTAAIYDDPANDVVPVAALTIVKPERTRKNKQVPGVAHMWDETNKYEVTFEGIKVVSITDLGPHGATTCPVTRFACHVDLDGRTIGLIEPIILLQDRINQTMFDLLITQTGSAFKVRTVSGMAPAIAQMPVWQTDPETGEYILDEYGNKILDHFVDIRDPETGKPIAAPIQVNASRFLYAKDPETKFGTLDETPLDGFIASLEMSVRNLSSIAQMPPHYLLGQIANLSAEALQAAESAMTRQVAEFQSNFGESWERVDRVRAELEGDTAASVDDQSEVIWRDLDRVALSRSADALGKMRQNLQIPAEGLWDMVPGVTQQQVKRWKELAQDGDKMGQLAAALERDNQIAVAKASRPAFPDQQGPGGN